MSLEETIKLDDDEEKGYVSYEGLKESFEVMGLELDTKLEEFIYFYIFSKSESTDRMKYPELISLLDEVNDEQDVEEDPVIEDEVSKEVSDAYNDDFDEPVW